MNALSAARLISRLAHKGQTDKAGQPYFSHPDTVARLVSSEEEKIVAYLHDTIEDTDVSLDELREIFGDRVADALALLTHDPDVPYFDYVRRLKDNPLARAVKLADLTHNSMISRIPHPTEKDYQRLKKYARAKEILLDEMA